MMHSSMTAGIMMTWYYDMMTAGGIMSGNVDPASTIGKGRLPNRIVTYNSAMVLNILLTSIGRQRDNTRLPTTVLLSRKNAGWVIALLLVVFPILHANPNTGTVTNSQLLQDHAVV
jgi:hypothetical protein